MSNTQSIIEFGSKAQTEMQVISQEMLSGVGLIESFRISEVSGDVVSYQVEVRGGADRLRRALRFAGLLEQTGTDNFEDLEPVTALEFFYNP